MHQRMVKDGEEGGRRTQTEPARKTRQDKVTPSDAGIPLDVGLQTEFHALNLS